jgi:hypothetical protein
VIGGPRRFSPDELPIDGGRVSASDLAASIAVARELDALATADAVAPSRGFSSRVMAAVAAEPAPQPVLVFGRALVSGRLATMLVALRDAWRVATSPGRPTAVRAQALALVMLALLVFGSVVGIAGAAVGLFESQRPDPSLPTRPAVVVPSPSLDPLVTITLPPTESPSPGATSPLQPTATPAPTARPTARPTTRPTASPRPMDTPDPTETDGDDGKGGESPSPSSPDSSDITGSGGGD